MHGKFILFDKTIIFFKKYQRYGNPEYDTGRYLHWNHRRLAHWNHEIASRYPQHRHEPPDDIGSNFYPLLGAYSSRSPTTIDKHMRMIRMSGAGITKKTKKIDFKNLFKFY